jgi:hypothetical protein
MGGRRKKGWRDLTPAQRRAIVVGGAAEVVVTAVVLRDLAKRPGDRVRGPKAAWLAACVVQPFGPLAYLVLGRR